MLGFFFTARSQCAGSFDAMQRLQRAIAGSVRRRHRPRRPDDARKVVRKHGWTFPVAFDQDGGVANLYGVAGCPEVVLAYPGGLVRETVIGRDRAERALDRTCAALVAGARARGWSPPA